jgi:DNA-binding transcriptional ArsR family regulator
MSVAHYDSLETLAGADQTTASWWASVARALDDLHERLSSGAAVEDGPMGALAEAVIRQPALSNHATRLREDHARLAERTRRLRRHVAQVAGDEREAPPVARELAALAAAEARQEQRSRSLLWDSLTRDIGGE